MRRHHHATVMAAGTAQLDTSAPRPPRPASAAARMALSVMRLVLTSAASFRCSNVDPACANAARNAGSNCAVSMATSDAASRSVSLQHQNQTLAERRGSPVERLQRRPVRRILQPLGGRP